jgi:acetyltransferase-like isoleucine patch superfamily enzyme
LSKIFGWQIHPRAKIGFSLILIEKVVLSEEARIGHFNTIRSFDALIMGEYSKIGNNNYMTGIGSRSKKHFTTEPMRIAELRLGTHSSITGRHFIDCCNLVEIGDFSIVAGAGSQILTHAIDIRENRQRSAPVRIGKYCFVGTGSVILRGAQLPDYSVLSANSTLSKAYDATYYIYSGVPAQPTKELDHSSKFFSRTHGYVE